MIPLNMQSRVALLSILKKHNFYNHRAISHHKTTGFLHKLADSMQTAFASCVICGRVGQGSICNLCQKSFVFDLPTTQNLPLTKVCDFQRIFNEMATPRLVTKREKTRDLRDLSDVSGDSNVSGNTLSAQNLGHISFFEYNDEAKKVVTSIKRLNFYKDTNIILNALRYYIKIDPFNCWKNLIEYILKTKTQFIFFVPIPSSQKSKHTRTWNMSNQILYFLSKLLEFRVTKCSTNPWVLEFNVLKNSSKITQKSLSLEKRIQNSMKNIGVVSNLAKKKLQDVEAEFENSRQNRRFLRHFRTNEKKNFWQNPENSALFIIFDDIKTSGSTLYFATKALNTFLQKNIKNFQILTMSVFNVTNKSK